MNTPYDDIIHLPHHSSPTRPRMSMGDRAAQFSPFAALSGHSAAIEETARFTEEMPPSDEAQELQRLLQKAATPPRCPVNIRYFLPDSRKSGGIRAECSGCIHRLHPQEKLIIMQDGTRIPLPRIYAIRLL